MKTRQSLLLFVRDNNKRGRGVAGVCLLFPRLILESRSGPAPTNCTFRSRRLSNSVDLQPEDRLTRYRTRLYGVIINARGCKLVLTDD